MFILSPTLIQGKTLKGEQSKNANMSSWNCSSGSEIKQMPLWPNTKARLTTSKCLVYLCVAAGQCCCAFFNYYNYIWNRITFKWNKRNEALFVKIIINYKRKVVSTHCSVSGLLGSSTWCWFCVFVQINTEDLYKLWGEPLNPWSIAIFGSLLTVKQSWTYHTTPPVTLRSGYTQWCVEHVWERDTV